MAAIMTIIDRESEKPVPNGVFTLAAGDIHESLRPLVGLYGIKALLSDRTSDISFGTGATPEEKMVAWGEVAELLEAAYRHVAGRELIAVLDRSAEANDDRAP